MFKERNYLRPNELEILQQESNELLRIIKSKIHTLKRNLNS